MQTFPHRQPRSALDSVPRPLLTIGKKMKCVPCAGCAFNPYGVLYQGDSGCARHAG